jgi:hypothetical protein
MATETDAEIDEAATAEADSESTEEETRDIDYWKSYARKHERQAKANADAARRLAEAERRLAELDTSKTDQEKEIERVRAETIEAARREAMAGANERIIRSEVRAVAGGKLADPEDAIRLLDLDAFEVGDDGEVDAKAIDRAVGQLLKDKPYLSADMANFRKRGDADQGARGRSGSGTSMNDLIRQKAGIRQ